MANKYSKKQDQRELDEGVEKYEKQKQEREEREDKPASRNHIVKYISAVQSRRPEIPQEVIDRASKEPTKGAAQRIIKKFLIKTGL